MGAQHHFGMTLGLNKDVCQRSSRHCTAMPHNLPPQLVQCSRKDCTPTSKRLGRRRVHGVQDRVPRRRVARTRWRGTAKRRGRHAGTASWLEQVSQRPTADVRHSPLLDKDNKLRTAPIYKLLVAGTDFTCPYAGFVWDNCTPPRAQFFTWLLVQERIKCRTTLLTKHVVQSATCELCDTADETTDHLILHCPIAAAFWSALGFTITSSTSVRALWELPRPSFVPSRHYHMFLHLCCWM
ncbi:hypothetical protein EJB05_14630, partial [Eragrostis curvula]